MVWRGEGRGGGGRFGRGFRAGLGEGENEMG